MQEDRRSFAKGLAMLAGVGAATVGLAGKSDSKMSKSSNGVVIGSSRKKEIIYSKSMAWEDYYRTAK